MKKLVTLFFVSCLLLLGSGGLFPVSAADFRSGDSVITSGENLHDLYLFGGTIRVESPVTNDIVAAGGDISINKDVTGSLIVAGGTIHTSGKVGNTLRAAGGNIKIDGPVSRDLIVSGGSVAIGTNATVGGDVAFSGGNLVLEGPVRGNVLINGGDATINGPVTGNVSGEIGSLTLGPHAKINGNLTYSSQKKAAFSNGAAVLGQTSYTPLKEEKRDHAKAFLTAGALYKLIADILLSILFIYFFTRALTAVLTRMLTKPIESGAIGFAFILLFPIAAAIALILLWLGVAAFISYALIVLISLFLVKIFLGWWVLRWWQNRSKKRYTLDWKAGLLGPVLLFILALIPFIGWLAAAIVFFIAAGALLMELIRLMAGQKTVPAKVKAATKKR